MSDLRSLRGGDSNGHLFFENRYRGKTDTVAGFKFRGIEIDERIGGVSPQHPDLPTDKAEVGHSIFFAALAGAGGGLVHNLMGGPCPTLPP